MTRQQLARKIAADADVSMVHTDRLLRVAFDCIVQSLVDGERLELRNFGVFEVAIWPARKVTDPVTQQTVMIPARRTARFRPSKNLRARLNAAKEKKCRKK